MFKILSAVFRVLISLTLIAKIAGWFIDYSAQTDRVINTAMFCLIGLAYIAVGYKRDNKGAKVLFMVCGVYLAAMNFLPDTSVRNLVGIASLITPLLITRFQKKTKTSF